MLTTRTRVLSLKRRTRLVAPVLAVLALSSLVLLLALQLRQEALRVLRESALILSKSSIDQADLMVPFLINEFDLEDGVQTELDLIAQEEPSTLSRLVEESEANDLLANDGLFALRELAPTPSDWPDTYGSLRFGIVPHKVATLDLVEGLPSGAESMYLYKVREVFGDGVAAPPDLSPSASLLLATLVLGIPTALAIAASVMLLRLVRSVQVAAARLSNWLQDTSSTIAALTAQAGALETSSLTGVQEFNELAATIVATCRDEAAASLVNARRVEQLEKDLASAEASRMALTKALTLGMRETARSPDCCRRGGCHSSALATLASVDPKHLEPSAMVLPASGSEQLCLKDFGSLNEFIASLPLDREPARAIGEIQFECRAMRRVFELVRIAVVQALESSSVAVLSLTEANNRGVRLRVSEPAGSAQLGTVPEMRLAALVAPLLDGAIEITGSDAFNELEIRFPPESRNERND